MPADVARQCRTEWCTRTKTVQEARETALQPLVNAPSCAVDLFRVAAKKSIAFNQLKLERQGNSQTGHALCFGWIVHRCERPRETQYAASLLLT